MIFSYAQICSDLLKGLSEKQKEVLSRRFALSATATPGEGEAKRETLEFIGKDFGVSRERVRQIEKDGLSKLKPAAKKNQKVFQYFNQYFRNNGGLKKESLALADLGGKNWRNQVYFLLSLGENFERFGETDDFYPFWINDRNSLSKAQRAIGSIREKLKKRGCLLNLEDLKNANPLNEKALISFLEISKRIQKNQEGLFGLKEWPEISPKGVKDKAYLVFKKEQKPLHFSQVAQLIDSALSQTVHNELIKDQRFILVGRGTYALREWGYEEGFVKDVIFKILKEEKKSLSKEEILEKTLKQRLVKENTVFLNLSNRKYFFRTPEGRYKIQES